MYVKYLDNLLILNWYIARNCLECTCFFVFCTVIQLFVIVWNKDDDDDDELHAGIQILTNLVKMKNYGMF